MSQTGSIANTSKLIRAFELLQQCPAFGQDRNVEPGRKPFDDGAKLLVCFSAEVSLDRKPDKIAGSVQLKETCLLSSRPCDRSLETVSGRFVVTFALPDPTTQPDDFCEVILFFRRFGEALSFAEADGCILKSLRPELVFGKHHHVACEHEEAAGLAPKGDAPFQVCQASLFIAKVKQRGTTMQQHVADARIEPIFLAYLDGAVGTGDCLGVAAEAAQGKYPRYARPYNGEQVAPIQGYCHALLGNGQGLLEMAHHPSGHLGIVAGDNGRIRRRPGCPVRAMDGIIELDGVLRTGKRLLELAHVATGSGQHDPDVHERLGAEVVLASLQ